jgi:hypothetical protein
LDSTCSNGTPKNRHGASGTRTFMPS